MQLPTLMHDLVSAFVSRPLGWLLDALARLPWSDVSRGGPGWRP